MVVRETLNNQETCPPLFRVTATAPIRICDLGGWTDTWFAKKGAVLNFAAGPGVEVKVDVHQRLNKEHQVTLNAVDLGKTLKVDLDSPQWVEKDLLEAAVRRIGVPSEFSVEISVHSEPPPGCSVGTSASVTVAVIAALAEVSQKKFSPQHIAELAQKVEVEDLKQQCGIQDQIAAAFGGICFIEMYDYPKANIEKINVSDTLWQQLDNQFCTFYLGRPHFSSDIHKMVVAEMEASPSARKKLNLLRHLARIGKDALVENDLAAFGKIMSLNTGAQRGLNRKLISPKADTIIEVAGRLGALGWKVNGAGGPDGGSITVLGSEDLEKRCLMIKEIKALGAIKHLNFLHLSTGGLLVKKI